jgi:two-component system osmolarity sensor histidine kinase EnvZ
MKRFLPRSLLGRSLLMILLPLILLQAVALQIFYGSHLDLVSRRLSGSVVSEIAYTLDLIRRFPDPDDRAAILQDARQQFELVMTFERGATLPPIKSVNILGPMDDDLSANLAEKFDLRFTTDWISDPQSVFIHMQMPDGVLTVAAPRKRLYTGTIYIFVVWIGGTALLVFSIAALFMRNQVRGIRRLAAAGAISARSDPRAPSRCVERQRRSIGCRSGSAAFLFSGPKCWLASHTTCVRR